MPSYSNLLFLLAHDFWAVRALTDVIDPAETSKLAIALGFIGVQNGTIVQMIEAILAGEYASTQRPEIILRASSCSTKMLGDYVRKYIFTMYRSC